MLQLTVLLQFESEKNREKLFSLCDGKPLRKLAYTKQSLQKCHLSNINKTK